MENVSTGLEMLETLTDASNTGKKVSYEISRAILIGKPSLESSGMSDSSYIQNTLIRLFQSYSNQDFAALDPTDSRILFLVISILVNTLESHSKFAPQSSARDCMT